MKVEDIRVELVKRGLSQEAADDIKGKVNLLAKLEELTGEISTDLEHATLDEVSVPIPTNVTDGEVIKPIKYNEPEWSDYVMSQFTDDEKTNGSPNIVGLRRMAEKLLGPITRSGPSQVHCGSDSDGNPSAHCVFEIMFFPFHPDTFRENAGRMFSACADSLRMNNNDPKFAKFPLAMAETRAEARALRRALKLKVVAAEELDSTNKEAYDDDNAVANDTQKAIINTMAERLGIDVNKLISDINGLTKQKAIDTVKQLNRYQTNDEPIPEILKKG